MKKVKAVFLLLMPYFKKAGLPMVYTGALLLIIGYILSWTNANVFLGICALLVITGSIVHVLCLKHKSKY